MHVIAAKAVAFGEAQKHSYRLYVKQVVKNANILARQLTNRGIDIVSGGTDTHLLLLDLRSLGITGVLAEQVLESVGITCNKNGIPFDPEKPAVTSGIRLGTPAATTRGFGEEEFSLIGHLIADVLICFSEEGEVSAKVRKKSEESIRLLCERFPIY